MNDGQTLTDDAKDYGERAAAALGATTAAFDIVARTWAVGYETNGAEKAEEMLETKLAFDQSCAAWRSASAQLALAGRSHFGVHWPNVANDLASQLSLT